MITYEDDRSRTSIHVLLDGKRVGEIVATTDGGYRFRTKKSGHLGARFSTVAACKHSLESDR